VSQLHAQAVLHPRKETPVPTVWTPESVWKLWSREKCLTTGRNRTPGRPTRSPSLHRLSYPGCMYIIQRAKREFPMQDIVRCQRTARQRLDEHFAIHARNNGTTRLCNPLLCNGSVNTLPRRRSDVTLQQYNLSRDLFSVRRLCNEDLFMLKIVNLRL
jgi:hypothetical protein